MKLLFVTETLSYGGAARKFVDLANAMVEKGCHVELLIYGDLIDIEKSISEKIIIRHETVDYDAKNWIQRNIIYRIISIKKINKFLKNKEYDLVISFNDMVNINLLLSNATKSSKLLISERSDPNYNSKYLQKVKKRLFRKADGIVFQTEGARDFFKGNLPEKIEIIANPIPEINNVQNNKIQPNKKIVSVARLWLYQKRQDILLKAFKEVSDKYKDYQLVLYGDGQDAEKIGKLIRQLNLTEKVVLAGAKNNVLNLIQDAEFFVLSSDFEGIPNALIEAMAIGLPVISTKCSPGGAEFLIEHGKNGLLVEQSNYKELSASMIYMIENPVEALKMGENARRITKKLDPVQIYNQWETFIHSL